MTPSTPRHDKDHGARTRSLRHEGANCGSRPTARARPARSRAKRAKEFTLGTGYGFCNFTDAALRGKKAPPGGSKVVKHQYDPPAPDVLMEISSAPTVSATRLPADPRRPRGASGIQAALRRLRPTWRPPRARGDDPGERGLQGREALGSPPARCWRPRRKVSIGDARAQCRCARRCVEAVIRDRLGEGGRGG